jgi:hypothetical protein
MFQGNIDVDGATPVEATAVPDILFERGLYWASGRSGVVNLVAAHKWFNLAALKGRRDAVALRQEIAALMSDIEIAIAQREARAWMATHWARGSLVGAPAPPAWGDVAAARRHPSHSLVLSRTLPFAPSISRAEQSCVSRLLAVAAAHPFLKASRAKVLDLNCPDMRQ